MLFHSFRNSIPYLDYILFQKRARTHRRESLLFLEHPPTITAGVSSHPENLLLQPPSLEKLGVSYVSVPRGGDHTAHEPGQIVIYPHIDLQMRGLGVSEYLDLIQGITREVVSELWKISLVEDKSRPGLYWEENPSKKIVSIGVYFKSFFTSFGLAINYENSLTGFGYINPCGISSQNMETLVGMGAPPNERHSFIKSYGSRFAEYLEKKYPVNNGKTFRWL